MTLTLFIDTTLSGAALALVSYEAVGKRVQPFVRIQAQKGAADSAICRMLAEGLSELGKEIHDIRSVVVSCGPGSFTGIKVGLAWAYGFQAARKDNVLVGLSSLAEGQAELARTHAPQKIVVLLPISRREAFLCSQDEEAKVCYASIVLFSEAAETVLKAHSESSFCLIATEFSLRDWFLKLGLRIREYAMAEFMQIAMDGLIAKAETLDLCSLQSRMILPAYFKKSTVEEKLNLKDPHVS